MNTVRDNLVLEKLTSCIKRGLAGDIKTVILECLTRHSIGEIVESMDQGIDELAREWYSRYDWDGKARHPNPPISYRQFEKAWEAYEIAWQVLVTRETSSFPSPSNSKLHPLMIGTGTLGNVHKAILRIDLHLRMKGWKVVFLGYDLKPNDVLSRERELDAVVLSIMAHSARVPALNHLKDLTMRWNKPIFVGGSAFRAIDAWLKKETEHEPYFFKEHSIDQSYSSVKEFTRAYFDGAQCVTNLDDLHEALLQLKKEQVVTSK